MAAGSVSASCARQVCDWTSKLPAGRRDAADEILLTSAEGGADLNDLAGLFEKIRRQCAEPDEDEDDGFDDRGFRLGITLGGTARAEGDLTAGCAAALSAVLGALGKKKGPEDTRTTAQRSHDGLHEACQRLIATGMLPAHGGQPTQAQVNMTLSQLRDLQGASEAEAAWREAKLAELGWLSGPEADGAACDASVVPMVSGHVDAAALDRLVDAFLATCGLGTHVPPAAGPGSAAAGNDPAGSDPATGSPATGSPGSSAPATGPAGGPAGMSFAGIGLASGQPAPSPLVPDVPGPAGVACGCRCGRCSCRARGPLAPATLARLRPAMLILPGAALSGPR